MLAHRDGDGLLRGEGTRHVENSATLAAVHAVQHALEQLPDWPNAERGSRTVFTTEGLDLDAVERSLQAFCCLTRPAGSAA